MADGIPTGDVNDAAYRMWAKAAQRSTDSNIAAALHIVGDDETARRAILTGAFAAVAARLWKHRPAGWDVERVVRAANRLSMNYIAQTADMTSEEYEKEFSAADPTQGMIAAGAEIVERVGANLIAPKDVAAEIWNAMQAARFKEPT